MKSTNQKHQQASDAKELPTKTKQSSVAEEKSPLKGGQNSIQSEVVENLSREWLTKLIASEIGISVLGSQKIQNPNSAENIEKEIQKLRGIKMITAKQLNELDQYE